MRKILVFLLCFFPALVLADVDTFEGQTGTDTWEGQSGTDTREGQAIASGGGGGATISDDFSSDTSANYGAILNGINVTGGHAEGAGANEWQPAGAYHTTTLGSANHYVQAECEWTADPDQSSIMLNITPGATPTTDAAGYRILLTSGGVFLYEFTSGAIEGAYVDDANWPNSHTWTSGNRHIVKASSNGSGAITVQVDWNNDGDFLDTDETGVTVTDGSAPQAGTYIGLVWFNDGVQNYVDNLEADAN